MAAVHRKRCKRYDVPGHAHALTFSCYRRLPLLSRDRSRQWMLEGLAHGRANETFDLWAYVIMPEHVHLVIFPRLTAKIAYIHNNPVRRGLVETPSQWRWSSYNAWATGLDDPIPIDRQSLPAMIEVIS